MKLNLPSAATVFLSLAAGLLVVLSTANVFGFSTPVKEGVSIVLVFLSAEGISPLTGVSFRSALHLSPVVSNLIGGVLAAATVAQTQLTGISTGAHAIIQLVLVVTAGLGFAPTIANMTTDRLANAARASALTVLILPVLGLLILMAVVA